MTCIYENLNMLISCLLLEHFSNFSKDEGDMIWKKFGRASNWALGRGGNSNPNPTLVPKLFQTVHTEDLLVAVIQDGDHCGQGATLFS